MPESLNVHREDLKYEEAKIIALQLFRQLPLNSKIQFKNEISAAEIISCSLESGKPGLKEKAESLYEKISDFAKAKNQPLSSTLVTLSEELQLEIDSQGNLEKKLESEIKSLRDVEKALEDHQTYLKNQLEMYQSYLTNTREQAVKSDNGTLSGLGVVTINGKAINGKAANGRAKNRDLGPYKYSLTKLGQDGILLSTTIQRNK